MRPLAAIPVALAVLAPAAPVAADGWSLHVLTNAHTGWTDNLFSVPEEKPPSQPGLPDREADFYTTITPGGLFTYDAHRHIHEAFYELDATMYVEHDEAWSLTHRAGWRAQFLISPLTELSGSVVVAGGTLNTFTTTTTAPNGTVQPLPSAESRFGSVEARELLTRELSADVRVTQDAVLRGFSTDVPDDMAPGSTGYEAGVGGGIERSWQFTAVGAQLHTTYTHLGDFGQMTASALGSWRRDLSERWASSVDAGVVTLVPLGEGQQAVLQPTIGAQVGYYPEWGSAGLSARRAVAPNLMLGANTITDSATVNAYLPLPWFRDRLLQPRFTIGSTVGYAHTSVLDDMTGDPISSYDNVLADVSLAWRISDQANLAARYQYVQQDAENDALENVFSYRRNTVLVTFYMRWPERVAAEVPDRETLRVNREDASEAGAEGGAGGGAGRR